MKINEHEQFDEQQQQDLITHEIEEHDPESMAPRKPSKPGSIRLSVLPTGVKTKIAKFDTMGAGEIDIQDAIKGIVSLHKQSTNWKRSFFFLTVPLILLTLGAVFGCVIAGVNMMKDMRISNDALVAMNGKIIKTDVVLTSSTFYDTIFSQTFDVSRVRTLSIGDNQFEVSAITFESNMNDDRIVTIFNPLFALTITHPSYVSSVELVYPNSVASIALKANIEAALQAAVKPGQKVVALENKIALGYCTKAPMNAVAARYHSDFSCSWVETKGNCTLNRYSDDRGKIIVRCETTLSYTCKTDVMFPTANDPRGCVWSGRNPAIEYHAPCSPSSVFNCYGYC